MEVCIWSDKQWHRKSKCSLIKYTKKFHKGFDIFLIKIVRRTNGLFPPLPTHQILSQISKHNLTWDKSNSTLLSHQRTTNILLKFSPYQHILETSQTLWGRLSHIASHESWQLIHEWTSTHFALSNSRYAHNNAYAWTHHPIWYYLFFFFFT